MQDFETIGDTKSSERGIYTSVLAAKDEVWRRWNDKELRKRTEDFLGLGTPDLFYDKPVTVLFRFIATPNLEFKLAIDFSAAMDLEIIFWEFLSDKFCTRNQDKVHLGKLVFSRDESENSTSLEKKRIIDFEKNEGKALRDIKTLEEIPLTDFHHNFLKSKCGDVKIFDVSKFKTNGESALDVYKKVFAFFVCHGVLLENYIMQEGHYERPFVQEVVFPALEEIEGIFGFKPLIVKLLPEAEEADRKWMWYSA
jgi:hypothetical protein